MGLRPRFFAWNGGFNGSGCPADYVLFFCGAKRGHPIPREPNIRVEMVIHAFDLERECQIT